MKIIWKLLLYCNIISWSIVSFISEGTNAQLSMFWRKVCFSTSWRNHRESQYQHCILTYQAQQPYGVNSPRNFRSHTTSRTTALLITEHGRGIKGMTSRGPRGLRRQCAVLGREREFPALTRIKTSTLIFPCGKSVIVMSSPWNDPGPLKIDNNGSGGFAGGGVPKLIKQNSRSRQ